MKRQMVAWSYNETYWNVLVHPEFTAGPGCISFDQRVVYHTFCQHVSRKINGVHLEAERINENLSHPIMPHYAGFCAADTLFYQIPSRNYNSLSPCASSALSLSSLISPTPPRWSDGPQRQIRDDVSSLPRASPAGAPYPQSERGPGKGEFIVHRFKSEVVFLSCPPKSEEIYRLTAVILHTKCCCSRQKEIKDTVDEKRSVCPRERSLYAAGSGVPTWSCNEIFWHLSTHKIWLRINSSVCTLVMRGNCMYWRNRIWLINLKLSSSSLLSSLNWKKVAFISAT